jgi:hypothetical protein
MSEIPTCEVKETKNPSLENYKNIKPESKQTNQEVNDFWKGEFQKESDVSKTENGNESDLQEYKDDNGVKYREGDNLVPDNEFEVKGYQYKTDDEGRIVSAEGKLKMRDPDYTRDMEDVRKIEKQEYRDGDDRGHLIGHQFGGSDRLENLVPMDAKLNQGDFVKLENTLTGAVKDGADVRMKVEPIYEGESTRPSEFRVTYSIDGDRNVIVFRNESEEKA